jgi:phosphoribosylformimino-5-aminoimidazole carboxamide ribotide isomerase
LRRDLAHRPSIERELVKILPSIDLRRGAVVRLKQGDYSQQISYDVDPFITAQSFAADGAKWLHLVDLDGAKEGRPVQLELVGRLASATDLKVQVGGGVRTTEDVHGWLDSDVERVVIGTRAMEDWAWFSSIVHSPPCRHRIVLALDAKDGLVATRGWTHTSQRRAVDVASDVSDWPLAAILYTDIQRDGMLTGPNLERIREIVGATKVPVIASGGVGTLVHVQELTASGAWGAIIGRSLYERAIQLADAIRVAGPQ